jgi:hypothetical protein
MAHHVVDLFHNKIQGGLENMAYPLIIRETFFGNYICKSIGDASANSLHPSSRR